MTLERPKRIKTGAAARDALMVGFGRTARLAGLTLGPRGGRVLLERADDFPELTRDGFTAIRDLEDDDRFATLGTELLKACVKKTRDTVGDGSTTTALLAGAFAESGLRLVAAGIDPPSVRRGFDGLTRDALEALKRQSGPVGGRTMLAQLALVAADGDEEIAGLVAEAVAKLGPEGVVNVSYHQSVDTTIDYMSGMAFDHGLLSRNFLLKAGETAVALDQPHLLMCQGELTGAAQLVPALEAARRSGRSLLVLAQDVSDQALAVLLANHREGTVRCAAVKGPDSGIYRHVATDDVAVLTGGRLVGEETGLLPEKIDGAALGSAKRAVVDGVSTTIFSGGGAPEAVERRAAQLRDAIGRERKSYDRGKLEGRLARLVSGVANIRVGGVTETAWKARHQRLRERAEHRPCRSGRRCGRGWRRGARTRRLRHRGGRERRRGPGAPRLRPRPLCAVSPYRRGRRVRAVARPRNTQGHATGDRLRRTNGHIPLLAGGGRGGRDPGDGHGAHQCGGHCRPVAVDGLRRRPGPPPRRGVARLPPAFRRR